MMIRIVATTIPLLCGGCGADEKTGPPNTFMEATIAEVKKETRSSKLSNATWTGYSIKFAVPGSSRDWYGTTANITSEDDLRRAIGERVSFSCYRDDTTITTCHGLTSLKHNGRELVRPSK